MMNAVFLFLRRSSALDMSPATSVAQCKADRLFHVFLRQPTTLPPLPS